MELTYLGHAGFCVETEQAIVVMDPWLSPTGAFDCAWFQFPCNHHLAGFVQEKLRSNQKACYIYISHEHKDHFDFSFLSSLHTDQFHFIIPGFRRTELYDRLQAIPCQSYIRCNDGDTVTIPGGKVTVYLDDSELDRDSAVWVRADGQSFLNLNDCKIFDRLADIAETGPVDVFTAQFSGAVWHPVCYDYSKKRYETISRKKMFSKFESLAQALHTLQPRLYLTSAGPPCFLDPDLIPINFEPVNIFPRAPKLFEYLARRLKGVAPTWEEPMPGDRYDVASVAAVYRSPDRVDDKNYASYLHSYAARYQPLFDARQRPITELGVAHTLERLVESFRAKLDALELRNRIHIPLYFLLREAPGQIIRVDFQQNRVEYVSDITESDFYSIEVRAAQIGKVLDGLMTWEDFMLSFRMTLQREPDLYQTIIHGFLVMDAADMNWFCAKVLDVESNTERMVIEARGKQYSVNRFCPHQGADLSHGWIEQDRYLVCPRHRWRYDLEKEGQCTNFDASIRAFGID